jgi:hypothetical protein
MADGGEVEYFIGGIYLLLFLLFCLILALLLWVTILSVRVERLKANEKVINALLDTREEEIDMISKR